MCYLFLSILVSIADLCQNRMSDWRAANQNKHRKPSQYSSYAQLCSNLPKLESLLHCWSLRLLHGSWILFYRHTMTNLTLSNSISLHHQILTSNNWPRPNVVDPMGRSTSLQVSLLSVFRKIRIALLDDWVWSGDNWWLIDDDDKFIITQSHTCHEPVNLYFSLLSSSPQF